MFDVQAQAQLDVENTIIDPMDLSEGFLFRTSDIYPEYLSPDIVLTRYLQWLLIFHQSSLTELLTTFMTTSKH